MNNTLAEKFRNLAYSFIFFLLYSRSYVFSSLASAAVSFATGAFGIWIPQYLVRAQVVQKTAENCIVQPCSSKDRSQHIHTAENVMYKCKHYTSDNECISLSSPVWFSEPSPVWRGCWEWLSVPWPRGSAVRRRSVPIRWCVQSQCWALLSSSASSLLWPRRALWERM